MPKTRKIGDVCFAALLCGSWGKHTAESQHRLISDCSACSSRKLLGPQKLRFHVSRIPSHITELQQLIDGAVRHPLRMFHVLGNKTLGTQSTLSQQGLHNCYVQAVTQNKTTVDFSRIPWLLIAKQKRVLLSCLIIFSLTLSFPNAATSFGNAV